MSDFIIKRNDTSPAIEYQLQDSSGNPIDISGYNTVKFYMEDQNGVVIVDDNTAGNVSVTDTTDGIVRYEWEATDTESAGYFNAEWEVEYSDGTVETFPNADFIQVRIEKDLE